MRCRMRCGDIWRCGGPIKKAPFVPVNSMLVDVDEQTDTFSVRVYSTNEDDLHYVQLDWTSGGTVGVSYVRKGDNEYNHNIFTQSVVNSMVQTIEQSYQDGTLFDGIYTFTDGARETISDYFAEPITPESTAEMQQALGSMPIVEDGYYTIKFVSNNTNYGTVDLELVNIRQGLERYIYASKEEYDYNTIEGRINIMAGEYENSCIATPEHLGSEEYTYVFDKFTYDSTTGTQVPFEQIVLIDRDMTIYANFKGQKCRYEISFDIDQDKGSVSPDSVVAEYGDLVSWSGGNTFTIGSTTVMVTPVGSNIITEVDMNGSGVHYDMLIHIHMGIPLMEIGPVSDISISGIGTEVAVNVPIMPYDADVNAYDFAIIADNCEVGEPEIVTSGQSTDLRFTLTSANSGLVQGIVIYMPSGGLIECYFNIEVIAGPERLEGDTTLTVQEGEPQTIEIRYYPENATNVLEHVTVESDSDDLTCVLNYAYDGIIVANVLATDTFAEQFLIFYLDGVEQFRTSVYSETPQVQSLSYSGGTLHLTVGEPATLQIGYSPANADYLNADIHIEDPDNMISTGSVVADNGVATYNIEAIDENTGTFNILLNGEIELSINYEAMYPALVQSLSYSGEGVIYTGPTDEYPGVEFSADVLPVDAEDISNVEITLLDGNTSSRIDILGLDGEGHLLFYGYTVTGSTDGGSDVYSIMVDGVEQFQMEVVTGNGPGGVQEIRSYYENMEIPLTPNMVHEEDGILVNYYPTDATNFTTAATFNLVDGHGVEITDVIDQGDGTAMLVIQTGDEGTRGVFNAYVNGNYAFEFTINSSSDGPVEETILSNARGSIVHNITAGTIALTKDNYDSVVILDRDYGATNYYHTDYEIGASENEGIRGASFQRGNCYPFFDDCLTEGTCSSSDQQTDASGYGPENYYIENVFRQPNSGEREAWDTSNNTNLWGGDSVAADSSVAGIANRGPCKPYTYIPTAEDMLTLVTFWNYIRYGNSDSSIPQDKIDQFCTDLLIPILALWSSDGIIHEDALYGGALYGQQDQQDGSVYTFYTYGSASIRPFMYIEINS